MAFWACEKCNGSGCEHGFWKNIRDLLSGKPIEKCSVCFGDGYHRPSDRWKPEPPPRPPLTLKEDQTERLLKILEKKH